MSINRDEDSFSLLAKEKEAKREFSPRPWPGPCVVRFALFSILIPAAAGMRIAGKTALGLPEGLAA